jgi:lincosamide nucleotidyltransferase
MLEQERLIKKVKEVATGDEQVKAVLLYGSFAYGEGDAYSDLDVYLFFDEDARDRVDRTRWLEQIAPVEFHYHNEYGIDTVMFRDLIRAEFHFEKSSDMDLIDQWDGWFPSLDSCILLDRNGELERRLRRLIREPSARTESETVQLLVDNMINWMVMGANLIERGEFIRAYTFQSLLFSYLLKMVRVIEGRTGHWINPFRGAEDEISAESYARFRECSASFESFDLARGFKCIWKWAHELIDTMRDRFGAEASSDLLNRIDSRFEAL